MTRPARCEVVDPTEIQIVHCINRTVRRCFLLGVDESTGQNFNHRKDWIEELLARFAKYFGIDLLGFTILCNHYHLVLRNRPDVVATWDDTEVARRWLMICPPARFNGKPGEPNEAELNSIRNNPEKLAKIRVRLSDVSWWLRLLNQRVAQRANREEGETGRFWRDRSRTIRLLDEQALVACLAYVDLNPVRAGIVETPEASEYTSVKRRIEAAMAEERQSAAERRDALLARLTIDEANDPTGPRPSTDGQRCSDKGVLRMSLEDYLELLDWTARQVAPGKRGATPQETPPILQRLGLERNAWTELMQDFDQVFSQVAGRCDHMEAARTHLTDKPFCIRPQARKLLPA